MIELFGLLLLLGLIAALILPWVNMARIGGVRGELERLRRELRELQDRKDAAPSEKAPPVVPSRSATASKPAAEVTRESREPGSGEIPPVLSGAERPGARVASTAGATQKAGASEATPPPPLKAKPQAVRQLAVKKAAVTEAEKEAEPQDWFSKSAIWVGSIALLMAGFYMIKYSMESGLLTPAVRVWLTTGFGALLCGSGFWIGAKSVHVATGRIGQALSGAGIACLYFAAYAAVHIYSFLTPGQGFSAMLAVTVLAVALSLKNGAPVAMMGLVGGFLTPWLMDTGSSDTVMLFSYLFLLFCGAQFLCLQRGWWALLLGSLLGAYLWSAVVIVGYLRGAFDHLEGTLVFVLGICLVNAAWALWAKRRTLDAKAGRLLAGIRWLTWCGGLVQGLVLVLVGGFAAVDMLLFSLLSVGALTLAVLREDDFIWAAWLALAAVFAGTLSNPEVSLWSWLLVPLGLGGLFFGVGHWRGLNSDRLLAWRSLSLAAAFLTVPLLYLNREWVHAVELTLPSSIWLGMSVLWALLIAFAGEHIFRREGDARGAGEYAAFAVILFGFGLWTFLPDDFHAHASAVLLIVAALYWKWRELGRSELVVSVFAAAWAGWMVWYGFEATHYFFGEAMSDEPAQDGLAMLGWALGVSGGATVFYAYRKLWSESAVQAVALLCGLFSLLGFVALYQWLDEAVMPVDWSPMAVGGGLTALLAMAAVVFAWMAEKKPGFWYASRTLAILAGLRVLYLHLFDAGAEGESFFFNALLLQFGVPFIGASLLALKSAHPGGATWRRVYQAAAMTLGFIWATFLVRDYFGSSELLGPMRSSTELYCYSVVWLLLAVAYQAIGLIRDQSAMHVGSLLLLLVTIGKVFLVDASQLEGLYRVLSFLGLGLVLIAIGFFYNKVVFARRGTRSGLE